MLNYIWLGLVVAAVVIGGFRGSLEEVNKAAFERAEYAIVQLALPLAGVMALWLGVMRLAERAGLIQLLARWLRPVMRRLFPDVPPEHPAMGSMLMNLAANMLGLSNAATPLGIRAMKDLETLNPRPGLATNAMCTFLAINTGSIQLIPATAVGVLAVAKSQRPSSIIGTAMLASCCATIAGVAAAKLFERLPWYRLPSTPAPAAGKAGEPAAESSSDSPPSAAEAPRPDPPLTPLKPVGMFALVVFAALFGVMFVAGAFPGSVGRALPVATATESVFSRCINAASLLSIPFLLSFFPFYAMLRGVKVYEEFVEGAKEGFQVSVRIMPFLVAILVAVGMFRAAGGVEIVSAGLRPVLDLVHFPTELLPMCLIRPLSGSATLGLFTDLVKQFGPDSLLARTAGTIYGSTETTFYVIAVYFGAVSVKRTRHAVPAGLMADLAGIVASVVICRLVFGPG